MSDPLTAVSADPFPLGSGGATSGIFAFVSYMGMSDSAGCPFSDAMPFPAIPTAP
jgi:pantoate kinase